MIVEALLTLVLAPLGLLLSLTPSWNIPAWYDDTLQPVVVDGESTSSVGKWMFDLGNDASAWDDWVPFGFLHSCIEILVAAALVAIAIFYIKFAISLFSGGGAK